jgi:endonuclease III
MILVPMLEITTFCGRKTAAACLRILKDMGAPAIVVDGEVKLNRAWWEKYHQGELQTAEKIEATANEPTWTVNTEALSRGQKKS